MKTLTFKVSDEEARLIRSLAKSEQLTVSEYLRRKAKGTKAAFISPELICCPHTGATIFGPLEEQPPLTTKSVREHLANFP